MNYENLGDFLHRDFNVFYHDRSYDKLFFAFQIMWINGMKFHYWKIYPIFKKLFRRVIYVNCIVLGMSNNITILDDAKHIIIGDNPSIDIIRGLRFMVQTFSTKFSKLRSFLGGGQ